MTAQPSGLGSAPFSSPFNQTFMPAQNSISQGLPWQYPTLSSSSSKSSQADLSGSAAGIAYIAAPSSSSSIGPTPINRKRRAASPTGHEAKKQRPNLAHGFSGLSISPETRKDGPVRPLFGPYTATTDPSGEGEDDGQVVDDDDALPPHQRELLIEELGDGDLGATSGSSAFPRSGQPWQAYNQNVDPVQRRPKHPPRQFSASNPLPSHHPSHHHIHRHHGLHTARPRAGYDESSSPSEASDAEDEVDQDNSASASQSPYMSRRPTIHADEVELPDAGTDDAATGHSGVGGMYGSSVSGRQGMTEGSGGGPGDVEVEELSSSPDKSRPFSFNFSHPHLPYARPVDQLRNSRHEQRQPSTHATMNRRRGMKRRTSSVSSEGDARQKKSRGMEEDGDLDMDLGAGADEQEMLDTPDERGQEIREIRGRSRARVKRGSGWYEPEKDRIIYTSLSSPSPSRSRSRTRSSSPPIEISTSDLSALPDLSQPGQQGFTISPSMLTRLLAAQRDAQARSGSGNAGKGSSSSSSSSSSSFPSKITIDGHDLPFDLSYLTPGSMKGMNERGLVLYRPLGILPGLSGPVPQARRNGSNGYGEGEGEGEGEGAEEQGGINWQDTVKRWAQGQKVPLSPLSPLCQAQAGPFGQGQGMEVELDGEEAGRGRFEELADVEVEEQYGRGQDAEMQFGQDGFVPPLVQNRGDATDSWHTAARQPTFAAGYGPGPGVSMGNESGEGVAGDGDIEME